jgi:hypothetical protein
MIKSSKWLAGAGMALVLGLTAPLAFGQTTVITSPDGSTSTTTTTVTTSSTVNPNSPLQFPPGGSGNNVTSHSENYKAAFLDRKIAEAKANGMDTSPAETQEVMGQAALRQGLNAEADQHFDAALRSIGVQPNSPE